MKNLYEAVRESPLLRGIAAEEFPALLACVQGRVQRYEKGDVVLLAGSAVSFVGIVVRGSVHVVREDSDGHSILMAELHPAELFAETFACAGVRESPVTVLAAQPCEVLLLHYRRVITTCSSACVFHARLIENMLALVAQKNLLLRQKIEILSKRTTRQRVLAYLQIAAQGKREFRIPYSRESLASYLCVDRSALSAELSRMQRDGLLVFVRDTFTLL